MNSERNPFTEDSVRRQTQGTKQPGPNSLGSVRWEARAQSTAGRQPIRRINQPLIINIGSCIAKFGCILGLLMTPPASRAGEFSLDFNTLPSSQGWTFTQLGQPAPESDVFTVSGGVLRQNTIGIGGGGEAGTAAYRLYDVIDPVRPYSISMRARVLQEERFPPFAPLFGFTFGGFNGFEEVAIGFTLSSIQTIDGWYGGRDPILMDTTRFHDYRLEVQPGVKYDLLVDSVLVASGKPYAAPFDVSFPNALVLGDGTGGANARAEITRFDFSQVPEPGVLALVLVGIAGLFVSQRREVHGFRSRK